MLQIGPKWVGLDPLFRGQVPGMPVQIPCLEGLNTLFKGSHTGNGTSRQTHMGTYTLFYSTYSTCRACYSTYEYMLSWAIALNALYMDIPTQRVYTVQYVYTVDAQIAEYLVTGSLLIYSTLCTVHSTCTRSSSTSKYVYTPYCIGAFMGHSTGIPYIWVHVIRAVQWCQQVDAAIQQISSIP